MKKNKNDNNNLSANEAWTRLITKYDIINKIEEDGIFHIEASQIKEFREPRLMAKWDSSEQLPPVLKENKINILPTSRHSYVLGNFKLYKEIPELTEKVIDMDQIESLSSYESIDVNNITSESNAINVLKLSNILDDFLGTDSNEETFNGRMGSGVFDFYVDTEEGLRELIKVNNAQCEIDGGFENSDSIVIMEAKNVIHPDFHVRQLYYPYRLWKNRVNKPIRLVFCIYANKIYRLFEYKFTDDRNYSSIELINSKNYSLQDTKITLNDLIKVRNNTEIVFDDNKENNKIPFIQANSFDRVISLLENIYDNPMNDEEIATLMHFGFNLQNGVPRYRQSQYYYNAGKYLELFEKTDIDGEGEKTVLTTLGNNIYKMEYKERQLTLVSQIFKHQIFAELFDIIINENNGELPDKNVIEQKMKDLNVCNEGQISRRASTVRGWIKWIFNLTRLSED